MQVKIFSCSTSTDLENKINNFIESKYIKLIDIKFQTYDSYDNYKALLIYEEV